MFQFSINKRICILFVLEESCNKAVPTGFEPAISALTGPHVWPLHHGTSAV